MTVQAWQTETTVGEVIRVGAVASVFQPIVHLDSGRVVAYEALARGPAHTSLERPDALFAAAASEGLTVALDWACQAAALRGALEAGLGRNTQLFINVEPVSLGTRTPPHLVELTRLAATALNVMVEVTERALIRDPAALVRSLSELRALGMGVAIDDVGADPASLALLPFVEPDVIKLDMRLVRTHTDHEIASIVGAVRADAERRGATILAEGIETDEHLQRALVFGAQLGQGWLFGRPAPLPTPQPLRQRRSDMTRLSAVPQDVPSTPWSLVVDRPGRRTTTKQLLMPMSHHIEQRALGGDPCVVLGAFQDSVHFTPATSRRYERLALRSMVGAIGARMSPQPAVGVRGGAIDPMHPLSGEWTVTVVGPHDAAALIARDLGDQRPDRHRRFEYVITHDRPTVIAAAQSLMQYLDPA